MKRLLSIGVGLTTGAALALSATPVHAASNSLTAQIKHLKVQPENNSGYVRTKFGSRAPTAKTRKQLIRQERRANGTWLSLWDGRVYQWWSVAALDADHTVALAEAWGSGARTWTQAKRVKFANDLAHHATLN